MILELKAVRTIEKTHESQLLNYLNPVGFEIGLLVNGGEEPEIDRTISDNSKKDF